MSLNAAFRTLDDISKTDPQGSATDRHGWVAGHFPPPHPPGTLSKEMSKEQSQSNLILSLGGDQSQIEGFTRFT